MKKSLFSTLLLSGVLLSGAESGITPMSEKYLTGAWSGNALAYLPLAETIPVIDGKEDDSEWNDALKISGFMSKNLLTPERGGYVALKRDADYLYCLVKTSTPNNDPGGGLVTNASTRDGSVYADDSVEFAFAPRQNPNVVYHLIFNADGVLFDRRIRLQVDDHGHIAEAADVSWNISGCKATSRAESGWWTLEVKFPLKEIGAQVNGIRFNIARNWSHFGTSALNDTAKYTDIGKMITGVFAAKSPVVRMDECGSPETGSWNISVRAVNNTPEKLLLAVMLRNYSWPTVNGKVERKMETDLAMETGVPPGGTAAIERKLDVNCHVRYLSAVLYNPERGNVYFSRLVCGKTRVYTGLRPVTGTFSIAGYGSGFYRHYPGYEKAVFEVTPGSAANGKNIRFLLDGREVKATVSGRTILAEIPLKGSRGEVSCVLLRDGKEISGRTVLCRITPKTWEWRNNTLGKERVVLPPFSPIRALGRDALKTLRSRYTFSPGGLPSSILADGTELFDAAPYSEMVIDGKRIRFEKGEVSVKVSGDGVDAETLTHSSSGGVTLKTRIHSEYDNFNSHACTLSGVEGRTVSRWTLYFPLKENEAPFFHAVANTIRSNPAGCIPAGKGIVWNGGKLTRATVFGQEIVHPAFVPYLWLGGIERGLAWFANSSIGMKLDRKKDAVRLVRSEGRVTLEVDLINRPAKLKEGHTIEFGTQATPVKPIDPRLRNMTYDTYGVGAEHLPNAQSISEYILGYPCLWSKTAAQLDYSLFEKFADASRNLTKTDFRKELDSYMAKHGSEIRSMFLAAGLDMSKGDPYENYRNEYLKIHFGSGRKKSLPYKYSDPRLAYKPDPVTQYFQAEWFNPAPQNYFGALRITLTPSAIDYLLYGYDLEFRHGMKGCYLDDMFLMPEINPFTTAEIDDEGEVHADTGLYAMRELVKRIAVLQHRYGHAPRLIQVHMTNAQIVPVFSFATSQLGWESNFGETPIPERCAPDMILVESTGLQVGNAPLALGGIYRRTTPQQEWVKKFDTLTRGLIAMAYPHGIGIWLRAYSDASRKVMLDASEALGRFGVSEKECVFEPCFNPEKAPREIRGEGLMISAYSRPGKKLLIIGNAGKQPGKFRLNGTFAAVRDAETGKPLAQDDRTVKPYDFRLIEVIFPEKP